MSLPILRAFSTLLALLCGGVLAGSAVAAQASPPDPAATVDAFHAALSRGDAAAVTAFLTPDARIFESGVAETVEEYKHHHLAADIEFARAVTREIVERVHGGDGVTAWVLTRSATTGTFRGREIALDGVETVVLERTGDGWRIVHVHWSARPRNPVQEASP